MLQALVNPDRDLGRQFLAARKYWRTNDRRETGIDESLTAHHREDPMGFRIPLRFVNTIKITASHNHLLVFRCLIFEHVRCFGVQPVRGAVNPLQVSGMGLCSYLFPQVTAQDTLDKRRPRTLWSGEAVDPCQEVLRECDRCLLLHTTIILLANRQCQFCLPLVLIKLLQKPVNILLLQIVGR
jgi:hypothetical protein